MAIAIDKMAYSDNCDDNLLFQYLYHLSVMLASKAKYFKTAEQYDEFGIFLASSAYFRLKNPKQNELLPNRTYKMTKIKSILNYLKVILYPRKVAFEQLNYSQVNTKYTSDNVDPLSGYTFVDHLSDSAVELQKVDFRCCLGNIPQTIREFLKKIPYKYESIVWYNIYVSCLLSFLNCITLTNHDKNKLQKAIYNQNDHSILINMLEKQSDDFVILYKLDDSMKDYIRILVMQLKKLIAKDLSGIIHESIDANSVIRNCIINNELNNESVDE